MWLPKCVLFTMYHHFLERCSSSSDMDFVDVNQFGITNVPSELLLTMSKCLYYALQPN